MSYQFMGSLFDSKREADLYAIEIWITATGRRSESLAVEWIQTDFDGVLDLLMRDVKRGAILLYSDTFDSDYLAELLHEWSVMD